MSIDKEINEKKMKRNINIDLAILPSHGIWLRMPSHYQALYPVFHASKLIQYSESTICGQKATPPPLTLIQYQEE